MYGWHGRILIIDLTNHSFHTESLSSEQLHSCLGGRGLGIRLFQDYANLEPCTPDSPLIMTTGPLSGTGTPASERLCILSRSPLTGTVFDTTAGGSFAHALKASGNDGLVITGTSKTPVALRIRPSGVDFISADSLWGKTTSATISALADQGVAAIGPAGENGILYANIVFSDGDNDGRGGLGTVMGSKRLKAIAVSGDQPTMIADPNGLKSARQDIMRLFRASPALLGPFGLHAYGTSTFVDLTNQRRMLPTQNFKATYFNQARQLSGPTIRNRFAPTCDTCYDCPIACKQSTAKQGRLPEYSTLSHFGALLVSSDLSSIINANISCRELGIDPISTASTLATKAEITGVTPHPDTLPATLESICRQTSDDPLLGLGSRRLAEALGHLEASMTVKSLELPGFDPRGATGIALSYCTSTLGGSHTHANMESSEILRKPVAIDRFAISGKARLLKIAEDAHAAYDSMIVCPNAFYAASLEEYAATLSTVTGHNFSPTTLSQIGAGIVQAEIDINRSNGFSVTDDMLPKRFFQEAGSTGDGQSVPALNKDQFTEELSRYNRIRNATDHNNKTSASPERLR